MRRRGNADIRSQLRCAPGTVAEPWDGFTTALAAVAAQTPSPKGTRRPVLNAVLAAKVAALLSVAGAATGGAAYADVLPAPAQRLVANVAGEVGVTLPGADVGASVDAEADLPTGDTTTDAPAEDAPVTDAPAEDVEAPEVPVTDAPAEDVPVPDAPVNDAPTEDVPVSDTPAEESPDAPVNDAPAEDEVPADEPPTAKAQLRATIDAAQDSQAQAVRTAKELRDAGKVAAQEVTGEARRQVKAEVRAQIREVREAAKEAHRQVSETAKAVHGKAGVSVKAHGKAGRGDVDLDVTVDVFGGKGRGHQR